MSHVALDVRVPGKLMVLGEYAVLDPGAWALVVAVDRFVHVSIEPSEKLILDCPEVGIVGLEGTIGRASPRWGKNLGVEGFRKLRFVHHALTLAMWVADRAGVTVLPFHMKVESELGTGTTKAGLGSSASVVTGVCAAVLAWADLDPNSATGRARLFKIAALSHFMAQEKRGSGADVAAAVHGGLVAYRNPGLGDLLRSVDAATGMPGLVDRFWEDLRAERIVWPDGHVFVSASTGSGASTRELIDRLDALEGTRATLYQDLRHELTHLLHDAIVKGTPEAWKQAMNAHQEALARFDGALGGAGIVTPPVERLIGIAHEHGFAAKISGAGGGDSVIALAPKDEAPRLEAAWRDAGSETLRLDHPIDGARITHR